MATPAKFQLRTFYVYSPSVGEKLGDAIVRDGGGGERTVQLAPAQAQYWLDQGIIGEKGLTQLGRDTKATFGQLHGQAPEDVRKETAKAKAADDESEPRQRKTHKFEG